MSKTQVVSPATSSVTVGNQPAVLPQHAWVVLVKGGGTQVFMGDQVDHWKNLQSIPNVQEIWLVENTPVSRAANAVLMHISGQRVDNGATRVFRA